MSGYSQPDDARSRPSPSDSPGSVRAEAPEGAQQPQLPSLPSAQQRQDAHKRVYQACIPCRRRKVRCDLGSVDNPHDPPCVRCRRESKECYFSATRRKRKNEEGSVDADDYVARNGRRRRHSDGLVDADEVFAPAAPPVPPSMRSHPLRRPGSPGRSSRSTTAAPVGTSAGSAAANDSLPAADEPNTPLENLEARSVMRPEVYGPHDALNLLYKAATDSPHHKIDSGAGSGAGAGSGSRPASGPGHRSGSIPVSHGRSYDAGSFAAPASTAAAPAKAARFGSAGPAAHATSRPPQPADPHLASTSDPSSPGYREAVALWNRFRFVRGGWFTAHEAIDYINYYYKYLSPLTPISPPTFTNPASHSTLLTEEPILAITLLTVASRHMPLSGTGALSRASAIHEQLWVYLRGMIERVVWGQEAFGGGFCGSGADESEMSTTAPWRGLRKGSLRTLGTIESLMIMTEWHPRALHFPPDEAIDELLLPAYPAHFASGATAPHFAAAGPSAHGAGPSTFPPADEDSDNHGVSVGGRRIDGWLEPAWRSDRMCWMLLSTGMGLAYELGVFDNIDELLETGAITRPEYKEEAYRLRASRIKRLLLIYLTQLAGRLGWTNMVPAELQKDMIFSRKRAPSSYANASDGQTPATSFSSASNAFNYIPDLELDDQIIHCWAGISRIMYTGNERLFRSRVHTTEIIQSGSYVELVKEFQPMLQEWWKEFGRFKLPTFIRHILIIEYEYVRIYVNSLALQAVVERCASNAGQTASSSGSNSGTSAPQLSPQTQLYYGKLPLGQLGGFGPADQEYVKEVVDGCRNLLRTVVDGLLPGGYLKHAPVRTYFRIISGAMFLLKTFALGAPRADVKVSIDLMDRTVDALRHCVVDDVHLGIRFADLLETLTTRLRNRFIHAPASVAGAAGAGAGAGAATAAGTAASSSSVQPMSGTGRGPHPHVPAASATMAAGAQDLAQNQGHGQPLALGHPPVSNGDLSWLRTGLSVVRPEVNSAGISATPFDATAGDFPYPAGLSSAINPSTPAGAAAFDNAGPGALGDDVFADGPDWGSEMWYLPAGPAFFQNVGDTNVAMTAGGLNVTGIDLLDYMAMDDNGF